MLSYLGRLASTERTARTNFHLGISLAFVAGALNAGGFVAIGQYTSHMTGIVSSLADNMVLGQVALVISGALSLASFIAGAASTALLVNYARRNRQSDLYIAPLALEAFLLLVFGVVGASLQLHELISISLTAILLCYVMGLQNALIGKISNSEIRTTHLTGLVTDFGIELGKLVYWNRESTPDIALVVRASRQKLTVQGLMIGSFFCGALIGALGFKYIGYSCTIPLAMILSVIALAPLFKHTEFHS